MVPTFFFVPSESNYITANLGTFGLFILIKMRNFIFVFFVTLMGCFYECMAQNSGLGFNYQAVVRKADGSLLTNSDVNLRVSLYPGQQATSPTWVETHKVRTDASGCFGVTVGKGTRTITYYTGIAAHFSDINFAAEHYWMKVEIQEGTTFREVSFAQLPSSPYSEVASNAFCPGMIIPFAGPANKIPKGWLPCDGKAYSRSEYANLWQAIGISWGSGDGTKTFNVPDLRGMFLRGVSDNSGSDPDASKRGRLKENDGGNVGNNVGSYQEDAIRNITGYFSGGHNYTTLKNNNDGAFYAESAKFSGPNGTSTGNAKIGFDANRVVPTGSDNRPKNVYVNYIIKY